jgi:hypothetical protein
MPGSLTALFDRYLDQAAECIAQLAPAHRRVYAPDVRAALEKIGNLLWDRRAHGIEFDRLRQLIDQDPHWDTSMVGMLEQEGVLLRTPMPGQPGRFGMIISFDALAGHIIADALIAARNRQAVEQVARRSCHYRYAHHRPRSGTPAGRGHHRCLGRAPSTAPSTAAVDSGAAGIAQPWTPPNHGARGPLPRRGNRRRPPRSPARRRRRHSQLFTSLHLLRGALSHPLNATFLHDTLSGMDLAGRDLVWTNGPGHGGRTWPTICAICSSAGPRPRRRTSGISCALGGRCGC